MPRIFRVEGRANKVFDVIKKISRRNPHMTISEAGRKGLLESEIQHTIKYELGKFPEVRLDIGIENN
jgi:hypothetical protein